MHQVLVTAAPFDAVTNSALEIRSMLREHGPSEIFAFNKHPDLADVHPVDDYSTVAGRAPARPTLVHVSMGDERFLPFVSSLPGDLVIFYHNLTPPEYFAAWDPVAARRLELGRGYLGALRDRSVLGLANSSFSALDLQAAGFGDVQVVGLIIGREEMFATAGPTGRHLGSGPVVLSVGQLYPHKRPDLLVAAFYELVTHHLPEARLVLAGAARLPAYAAALERYVRRLGLRDRVTLTGVISDREMLEWYRTADLFVTVSEHEGFCVPLVEAMLARLPIVGRANAAVPETLGDAGLLLPDDAGPVAIGRVLGEVLIDRGAAAALADRGGARSEYFSDRLSRRRMAAALSQVAGSDVTC